MSAESHGSMSWPNKQDTRPQKGCWAPGDYTGRCVTCKCCFIGDKRAAQCADCAYAEPVKNVAEVGARMSNTPRTDAAEYRQSDSDPAETLGMVDVDFARQLERELNAANTQVAELERELESHVWEISPAMAQAKIDQLNEKVKRLVKVGDEMERWMRNPRNLGGDPFMADQWQDAKEATR